METCGFVYFVCVSLCLVRFSVFERTVFAPYDRVLYSECHKLWDYCYKIRVEEDVVGDEVPREYFKVQW